MEAFDNPAIFKSIKRNSVTLKCISIGILSLILLIPASMLKSVVFEREAYHHSTLNEIAEKWGKNQTVTGPLLTVPYRDNTWDKGDTKSTITRYIRVLPENLNIECTIIPEMRYRGIYKSVVYQSTIVFEGAFMLNNLSELSTAISDIYWDKSFFILNISDLQGLDNEISCIWNGKTIKCEAGPSDNSTNIPGIKIPIASVCEGVNKFRIEMQLNGSDCLLFAAVGKNTRIKMISSWQHPNFTGDYLPISHEIDNSGFTAEWKVSGLKRIVPQRWIGDQETLPTKYSGVKLQIPADEYQQTMRALKYALLFIILTFASFFIIEIVTSRSLHVVQYILVGSALVLFYALLLSISEYTGFAIAYIIASVATIFLILFYTMTILKEAKLTAIIGSELGLLYGFLYVLLKLQEYSLLAGTIGLFVILAGIMIATRNIDWFNPVVKNKE